MLQAAGMVPLQGKEGSKKFIVQNRNMLVYIELSVWNVSAEDVISLRCPRLLWGFGAVLALS